MSAGPATAVAFRAAGMTDLERLKAFVADACRSAGANDTATFALCLAVEEVFSNICEYGYAGRPGPVDVRISSDAGTISVQVADQAAPFNPADAPAPDLTSDWEHREPGGLGWHLVRELTDDMAYRRGVPRGNVVTLLKKIPVQHAGA